jgi:hypothetical protein
LYILTVALKATLAGQYRCPRLGLSCHQHIINKERNIMIRGISLLSLIVLLLGFVSWQPQSGLTSDKVKRIESSVRISNQKGDDGSALWVRNLGNHNVKLTMSADSASAQEDSYVSESIAGGHTVRLDKSLPVTLRGSNNLLIRSEEQIAVIAAPENLPIERSEFYYSGLPQERGDATRAPKWVMELGAIGKTGANVLKANSTGYAPAVKGQSDANKRYVFGVGVALNKKNSSVEIKLINRTEQVIKSVTLSSSKALFWQGELGEFTSGTDEFPNRVEVSVLSGKVQGFLSMKNAETAETTILPVVPRRGNAASKGKEGSIRTLSWPYDGGYAYFSNGVYDCAGTTYSYVIYGAPPNVCGTLNIVRNGNFQQTPNWICTDSYGNASKSWPVSTDQTGTSIYIQWPDGTTTSGGDYKVDDASAPSIWIDTCNSSVVEGSASDTAWGSGFDFGWGGWSSCRATFQQAYWPYKYWDGSGYNSYYPVEFTCSVSPSGGGYSINWSIVPPPSAGSTEVRAIINDYCTTVYSPPAYY